MELKTRTGLWGSFTWTEGDPSTRRILEGGSSQRHMFSVFSKFLILYLSFELGSAGSSLILNSFFTVNHADRNNRAGLAQLLGRLTAELEVVGSIPGAGPKLGVLK